MAYDYRRDPLPWSEVQRLWILNHPEWDSTLRVLRAIETRALGKMRRLLSGEAEAD